jgi:multiple sugar transport system substrate-binding protein
VMKRRTFAAALGASLVAPALLTTAARAADPTVIRYWDFVDPKQANPRGRALAEMLENFKKKRPDIDVKVEILPWQQIEPMTIQAAAAGKTPDVVRMQLPTYGSVVAAGALMPLDPFTSKLGADFKNDFILDWNGTVWDGKKMALPWDHRAGVLWYREDILAQNKLAVPKTLDELGKVGQALAGRDLQGFVVSLARSDQAFGLCEWFIPILWSAGGEVLTKDGKPAFNSPAGVRAVERVVELIRSKAMPASVLTMGYESVFQGAQAGTIALNSLGSHRVVTARAAAKLKGKLKTAPLPGFQADQPAPPHINGWVLGMGKDTKTPEAGWALIEHFLSPESLLIFARVAGELPARKSAFNQPWFSTPEAAEMVMWKDYFLRYGRIQQYRESPVELWQALSDVFPQVINRGRSPKEALDEAAAKVIANRGR